jgi:flagellin
LENSGLRRALSLLAFGLASVVVAPLAYAQTNLVQNPGFEQTVGQGTTATSSPFWTVSSGFGTDFVSGGNANSGVWSAEFAATSAANAQSATLSQTIATVPGNYYVVSFFLANFGSPHDTFLATFGGQTVLSLTDAPAFSYTQYSMVIRATSAQTVLAFTGEQDPASFGLDDVSVVAGPAPVMGGGLVSLGLTAAGFVTRRVRRMRSGAG